MKYYEYTTINYLTNHVPLAQKTNSDILMKKLQ